MAGTTKEPNIPGNCSGQILKPDMGYNDRCERQESAVSS